MSLQPYQVEHNTLMKKLKRPLFSRTSSNRTPQESFVDLSESITIQSTLFKDTRNNLYFPDTNQRSLYGVTFNPHPLRLFNKKQYRKYTQEQQRSLLQKIEADLRKFNPTIELIELHYEIANIHSTVHFHGMYSMDYGDVDIMRKHYGKYEFKCHHDNKPFKHFDLQLVKFENHWLSYIRKDSKKQDILDLHKIDSSESLNP